MKRRKGGCMLISSEKRIDDPLMYEREWKKNLFRIYAFENGAAEDVTKDYKMPP